MNETGVDALQSAVILFLGTKGKGQFFTADQLYQGLAVAARSPPRTLDEFKVLLREMAARRLLRLWKANPTGAQAEVFTGM
jgi:hypothetical protein